MRCYFLYQEFKEMGLNKLITRNIQWSDDVKSPQTKERTDEEWKE